MDGKDLAKKVWRIGSNDIRDDIASDIYVS